MGSDEQRSLHEQLPDLPALESVEISFPYQPVFAAIGLVLVGGFVFMAAWIHLRYSQYAPDTRPFIIAGGTIGIGMCLWIAYRMLWSDFQWRTDESCLFTRSLLRRRFTRWQDLSRPPRAILAYGRAVTTLEASIWQHLRHCGKADMVKLTEHALSLWDTIPDDLPREIDWDNPRPARRTLKISEPVKHGLGLLGFVLICLWKLLGSENIGTWGVFSLYGAFFAWGISWQNLRVVDHVSLQGRRLEARTAKCTLILQPGDVKRAGWWPDGLRLILRDKSVVVVPIDTVFDESSKLALAIIRWLREAPKPVPISIPAVLRSRPYDDLGPEDTEQDEEAVELRHGLAEKIAISLLASTFTCTASALALENYSTLHILVGVVLIAAASIGLLWWLLASYRMTADQEGIAKRFMWWSERAKWTDVASYTIGNLAGQGGYYSQIRRVLRDTEGRVLTSIPSQIGPKPQWRRFLRFVYARLAENVPADGFHKPWKSRPYSIEDAED